MSREVAIETYKWIRRAITVASVISAAGYTGQQIVVHLKSAEPNDQDQQLAQVLNQSNESSSLAKSASTRPKPVASARNRPKMAKVEHGNNTGMPMNIDASAGAPMPGMGDPRGVPGASGAAPPPPMAGGGAMAANGAPIASNNNGRGPSGAAGSPGGSGGAGALDPNAPANPDGASGGSGAAPGSAGAYPVSSPAPSATPDTGTTTITTNGNPATTANLQLVANFTPQSSLYSASVFTAQPSFTVQFISTNGTDQTVRDTASMVGYTDSACTSVSNGTVTAAATPVPFTLGIATFSNAIYTVSDHTEQSVYFKGTTTVLGLSICLSTPVTVVQHFDVGYGYLTLLTGANGIAGAAGTSRNDDVYAINDDGNGNYLVGGTSANASGGMELFIERYFPDGTLDTSFGSGGVFLFQNNSTGPASSSAASRNDQIRGIQTDSSGNVVAVGTTADSAGGTDVFLLRLTSAGVADTNLSATGTVVFNQGVAGFATAAGASKKDQVGLRNPLLIDTDGSYLVAISSANTSGGLEAGLVRILSTGTLSTTFNSGAAALINHAGVGPAGGPVGTRQEYAESVITDGSDNPVVLYSATNGSGGADALVARFTGESGADGVLDPTFNGIGYLDVHSAVGNASPADIQIDSSSNIVGASQFGTVLSVFRLTNAGVLDATFNTSGLVYFNQSGPSAAGAASAGDAPADLTIDSSGNYLVAGSSTNSSGGSEIAAWRFTSTGTIDTTYGAAGTGFVVAQRSGGLDFAGQSGSTALDQTNGNIYFDTLGRIVYPVNSRNGIGSDFDFALARFTAAGALDN